MVSQLGKQLDPRQPARSQSPLYRTTCQSISQSQYRQQRTQVRWLLYLRHDIAVQTYLGRLQPFGNTLKTPTNPRNSAFGKDPRNAIRKETDQRINREAVESTAHVTSQGFMFNCLPAKRLSLCGPGYDTRSQDQVSRIRRSDKAVEQNGYKEAVTNLQTHPKTFALLTPYKPKLIQKLILFRKQPSPFFALSIKF
ncbi:hypothetical protein H4Q26_006333 [Puccinia striiformis f. sp. tritici PST-130]|nr:hypothetical protein H4Q26_006333 [Puccinia striiformis f. sp. tritici PST-130]